MQDMTAASTDLTTKGTQLEYTDFQSDAMSVLEDADTACTYDGHAEHMNIAEADPQAAATILLWAGKHKPAEHFTKGCNDICWHAAPRGLSDKFMLCILSNGQELRQTLRLSSLQLRCKRRVSTPSS